MSAAPAGAILTRFAQSAIAVFVVGLLVICGIMLRYRTSSGHEMVKNGKSAATESKTDDAKTGSTPVPAATPAYEPQFQDRKITDEQRARFVTALRGAPQGKVFVSTVKGDREAYLYAAKIASMLREAGFGGEDAPVTFLSETEAPQNLPVILFISDKTPIRPHVLAIQNALALIGIRCDLSYHETPGRPGDLQIAVYPQL